MEGSASRWQCSDCRLDRNLLGVGWSDLMALYGADQGDGWSHWSGLAANLSPRGLGAAGSRSRERSSKREDSSIRALTGSDRVHVMRHYGN